MKRYLQDPIVCPFLSYQTISRYRGNEDLRNEKFTAYDLVSVLNGLSGWLEGIGVNLFAR